MRMVDLKRYGVTPNPNWEKNLKAARQAKARKQAARQAKARKQAARKGFFSALKTRGNKRVLVPRGKRSGEGFRSAIDLKGGFDWKK